MDLGYYKCAVSSCFLNIFYIVYKGLSLEGGGVVLGGVEARLSDA